MSSREGVASIASWLWFLREFVAETAKLLKFKLGDFNQGSFENPPKTFATPLLNDKLFFKPVRLRNFGEVPANEEVRPFRIAMSRALEVYETLHRHEAARDFVHFPLGTIQMPGSAHPLIASALKATLTGDKFPEKDQKKRQPYFVFDRLRLHTILPEDDVHKKCYVAKLFEALEAFDKAGVVHLDLRPDNTMWGCSCEETSGGDKAIEHDFTLKVIDWEDSFLAGEVIPRHVVQAHIGDPNRRYTLSHYRSAAANRGRIVATSWLDRWMVNAIAEFLSQDRGKQEWADFMLKRAIDPRVENEVVLSGALSL